MNKLSEKVKDLYTENCKSPMREMKQVNKWEGVPGS